MDHRLEVLQEIITESENNAKMEERRRIFSAILNMAPWFLSASEQALVSKEDVLKLVRDAD